MKQKTLKVPRSVSTELENAAREFDQADYSPKFQKAPPAEQHRHDLAILRARRTPGRPVSGAGAERIQITVERKLLADADEMARQKHLSRSALIAHGLRLALAS